MQAIYVQENELRSYCQRAFEAYGFSNQEAEIITDVLVTADLYGIETHGSQRLEMYRQHIQKGYIKVGRQPEIAFETPISAVVDGKQAMGQLVGKFGMELAITKAKQSGIGMVTVRNSNHYGIAGYYSNMALPHGLIGVSMTNSFPIVVPTYGRSPMMGTNPIAVSIAAEPTPFYLDIATSVAAVGKVEVCNKKGVDLPTGWGINEQGVDELNPKHLIDCVRSRMGGLYPLGGSQELFGSHKGYGLAVLVEFLTASLSQGTTANHVQESDVMGVGHYFMAIDPKLFGNPDEITRHWSKYLQELRDSEKALGQTRIYTHGEKEYETEAILRERGVPILPKTIEEMKQLAEQLNIEWNIAA
ncbi:Ldh family oxidoreductase [Wielerella bovis]|uniref:Ldh family oxidoreductase n=1 Tax=Wielerella bovis TaxID=2917790 RepID=UPI0020189533|nr:Ldh family oxidoreductase [Wielerella bovis]ULJ61977.1 Ldh family oxidoreductase [Wielerella bovis]ULJ64156.1 Ldh family oxidoreductase [Wielerella bovis]ULJ67929.1 Ldh family oxidoreductase [Wielerella bovis]ULJ68740.1 Ldh family oxidoreductase [Wielerella bovis]